MILYVCKYTPVEILKAFDEEVFLYNPMFENLDSADELVHRNVCSLSRGIITGRLSDSKGTLVLTACCDSIRRLYDILKKIGQDVIIIDLPRKKAACSHLLYKKELLALIEELEGRTRKKFNIKKFLNSFEEAEPIEGPYVALMGGRLGDDLMGEIFKVSPLPVKNKTCTGLRYIERPSLDMDFEELMGWYARKLLKQIPCMRMDDISSRRYLFEDPNLIGIIYNTVKFCDYYSFEYAKIRERVKVPILKIETDYTIQGDGQMATRLQAFFESLNKDEAKSKRPIHIKEKAYFAGIDSGSTSTNVVILDKDKNIISTFSEATGAYVNDSANKALDGALKKVGLSKDKIKRIVTTGYGRNAIKFKERDITEITCHAKGAFFINPNVRTIIDIGGQDSKIIRLNEKGEVRDFVMNDKCAAGTGKFLEMMASSLGLTLEEMSKLGFKSREKIIISSMCSVFAQSEVVSLVARGRRLEDIVAGINGSVAAKVTALAGLRKMEKEWMMTGGVAKNTGVVAALEERLKGKIIVPEEPEICGALGAALFAMEG
ncbi:MAG: 2-hydroxyglutaryl-CoA dehydratase [Tissierellia bacterium]|nr:2-hydroxyglutaryl-CoA dehydratase [Tissierellia bacterium]